jgi:hypothetical protein
VNPAPGAASITTTLAPGEDKTIPSEWCPKPASISGHVYRETKDGTRDCNRIYEPQFGEAPIPGVQVVLTGAGVPMPLMTTTNAMGFWEFQNLLPGTYTATLTDNTGTPPIVTSLVLTTGSTKTFQRTLPAGGTSTNNDSFFCPGSLTVDVFRGKNCDNVKDPAPDTQPLAGVAVVVAGPEGPFNGTTGANGQVTFYNLLAGMYVVTIDGTQMVLLDLKPAMNADNQTVTLAPGEDKTLPSEWCPPPCELEVHVFSPLCEEPCGPCEGGVTALSLRYDGTRAARISVGKPGKEIFTGVVAPGEVFSYRGAKAGDKVEGEVYIDGVLDVAIHTSCSQPVGPGTKWGSFTVTGGESKKGGRFCDDGPPGTPPGGCGECKGKVTTLTLEYQGQAAGVVRVDSKSGTVFNQMVAAGERFTFQGNDKDGTLGTNIDLFVDGAASTSIHTSCSRPIGPGQVYGPFLLVSGRSLTGGELCPAGQDTGAKKSKKVAPGCKSGKSCKSCKSGKCPPPAPQCRDCDNVYEAGDRNLAGIQVRVEGVNGTMFGPETMTTNAEGRVLWTGLFAGDYQVTVDGMQAGLVNLKPATAESALKVVNCPRDGKPGPNPGILRIYVPSEWCPAVQPPCGECKGKVTTLTLQYQGQNAGLVRVDSKSGTVFNEVVAPGEMFTFTGNDKDGTLGTNIDLFVDGAASTSIHTSCSRPIGPGQVYGPFLITAGASLTGGALCPLDQPPGGCGPCEGGVTALSLRYDGTRTARISVGKPGKEIFNGTVAPGEIFSYRGAKAGDKVEEEVYIDGVLDVAIHVSCSQPVGPGTKWGSFTVAGGESKKGGPFCDGVPPGTPPGGACGCDGKVTELTLRYDAQAAARVQVTQKGGIQIFDGMVAPQQTFTFNGQDKDGTMGTNIEVWVNGVKNTDIHTSCSKPIGPGLTYGAFTVTAGRSLKGGDLCPNGAGGK